MCSYSSSNHAYGESTSHGESIGWNTSKGIGRNDSSSIWWGSSDDRAARSAMRLKHAAEDLEIQIRSLAKLLTVSEFIDLRAKVEDSFDAILLAGRV